MAGDRIAKNKRRRRRDEDDHPELPTLIWRNWAMMALWL